MVPSPPSSPQSRHSLRLNPTGSEDFERSRWFGNLKKLRGLYVKEMTSYLASYMEGKFGGIKSVQISKKSYKRDNSHSTSNAVYNRWIGIAS